MPERREANQLDWQTSLQSPVVWSNFALGKHAMHNVPFHAYDTLCHPKAQSQRGPIQKYFATSPNIIARTRDAQSKKKRGEKKLISDFQFATRNLGDGLRQSTRQKKIMHWKSWCCGPVKPTCEPGYSTDATIRRFLALKNRTHAQTTKYHRQNSKSALYHFNLGRCTIINNFARPISGTSREILLIWGMYYVNSARPIWDTRQKNCFNNKIQNLKRGTWFFRR